MKLLFQSIATMLLAASSSFAAAVSNFNAVPIPRESVTSGPNLNSRLILDAESAEVTGEQLKLEQVTGKSNLGFWDRTEDFATWQVRFKESGKYKVRATLATVNQNASLAVELGGARLVANFRATTSWSDHLIVDFGEIVISQPGAARITPRAADKANRKALNLRDVQLLPVQKE